MQKMFEEYLVEQSGNLQFPTGLKSPASKILLHGHCHQKAMNVMPAIQQALGLLPDTDIETIETSCCGMAGAFGYSVDTQDVSVKMAELSLLPAIREAGDDVLIVADGIVLRHQIADHSTPRPLHVARLFEKALEGGRH